MHNSDSDAEDITEIPAKKKCPSSTKNAKKQKKQEELHALKEKNKEMTKAILGVPVSSPEKAPRTVAEAKLLQNQKRHPQFGGKCPKDIHSECRKTIESLRNETEDLKLKLKERPSSKYYTRNNYLNNGYLHLINII